MFNTRRIESLESAHDLLRLEHGYASKRVHALEQQFYALLDHLKLDIDEQPAQLVVRKVTKR